MIIRMTINPLIFFQLQMTFVLIYFVYNKILLLVFNFYLLYYFRDLLLGRSCIFTLQNKHISQVVLFNCKVFSFSDAGCISKRQKGEIFALHLNCFVLFLLHDCLQKNSSVILISDHLSQEMKVMLSLFISYSLPS